jgi:hypothetical protein
LQKEEQVKDEVEVKEDENLNGEAKKRFPNGDEYEGEWKEGKMHGKGVYRYMNGNRYEGEYSEGLFDGKGKTSKTL